MINVLVADDELPAVEELAFLLGKELQAGFLQWREGRRGE